MNQSSQHGNTRKSRTPTNPAVAPISRAIRAALAVSATMLTLFTPVASWAASGTCAYDAASNTYACNGDFSQTLPDAGFIAPADLTVVLGDQLPSSVHPASGQVGIDAAWAGDVSVVVGAGSGISTSGADGIRAYSADAAAMVANYGSIDTAVTAADAEAMDVGGVYDVTVVNGGDVSASDADGAYDVMAANLHSTGYAATTSFDNTAGGSLDASALDGSATALAALAGGDYGTLYISNAGVINADSVHGDASGIVASAVSHGYTTIQNSGSVHATGYGSAVGVDAFGDYSSTLDNSGDISASADTTAADATAYAASNVSMHLSYLTNEASGSIVAAAHSGDGLATAVGAYAVGGDVTTVHNYGAISAGSSSDHGDAQAYAAAVIGYSGIGLLINGGDLQAEASAGAGADAQATGAFVIGAVASVFNDASSSATATAGEGGTAIAKGAHVNGANSAINTYGDLSAIATVAGGTATAIGADAYGYNSSSFYGSGGVTATAIADEGAASATGVYSIGVYNAYATSKATISATASGGQSTATGLLNQSYFVATTTNEGSISAAANGTLAPYGQYEAVATGVYNLAVVYDSLIDNSGSISAIASATTDIGLDEGFLVAKALGARAVSVFGYGEALIDNSGDIDARAVTGQGYASAWGAIVQAGPYGGHAEIDNDGSISSSAQAGNGSAVTLGAYLSAGSSATIVNHGDISTTARAERGVHGVSLAAAYATGVLAYSNPYGGGGISVGNYGTIDAHSSILGGITSATALQVSGATSSINNAEGATISAASEADLFGGSSALAVSAAGLYSVDVVNDGAIAAYGRTQAYSEGAYGYYGAAGAVGVSAVANYRGNASVVNNGDIAAHAVAVHSVSWAQGGAGATGVSTYAKYDAIVENSSNISAIADSEFGIVGAYGVMNRSKYYSHLINDAGGSIVASASVGSLLSDEYGGRAVSFGTHSFGNGSSGVTYNAGSIVSHAVVTADGAANEHRSIASAWGAAVGAYSNMTRGTVINAGDIEAAASADFGYATAFGSYVLTHYDSSTSNTGTIRSNAIASNGDAFAVGSYAFALHQQYFVDCDDQGYCDYSTARFVADDGKASLDNTGQITAAATAHGGVGHGYGASILGAFVTGITNSGQISARVDADDARAVGALANSSYGYATLQNSGTIGAIASGDIASASGVFIAGANGASHGDLAATIDNQGSILARATGSSATAIGIEAVGWKTGGIRVDNAGTIAAAAYGADATATAVSMASSGANELLNTGVIGAYGEGARIAVASGIGAAATITNDGSIIGGVVTGNLDDSLTNAAGASWRAVGSSDFGDGDDHVVNRGTLFMDDAAIHLGGYTAGNTFDNFGTIKVSGSNVIDMDNPFPVNNNGVISFVDGVPDDVLTVVGDFAGEGAISVDVSGLHQTGDRLYVEGNVSDSAKQAINVNLLDMPTAPSVAIPVITASGTLAGEFTLGRLQAPGKGFVTTDFGLKTTASAVSLVMDVTGLNDTGSLASAMAPGAQSLVNAQVGSWRERMGVVPEQGGHGLAPWVRTFSDSGDVNLARSANFGPGGTSAFHQSNHGLELGVDTRLADHLSAGVLIGSSEGSQRLTGGAGSDRLDGRTFGLYGTWLAENSFYFDLSQRWTSIRAHLRSGTSTPIADASASALNIETGITAWTLAGVHVVPQLQYTRTRIDGISTLSSQQSDFADHGGVSSRGRVGVAVDRTIQGTRFSWTPYGSVNAVREFNGKYGYAINGGLLGKTSTAGTSAMVELGLGARRGALSITGGVNWTDGGALQNVIGGQLAVRYSW